MKVKFRVTHRDDSTCSRAGVLEINGKQIHTPILWLGQIINGVPKPWEYFEVDALMVNACDIINQYGRVSEKIMNEGIHKYLNFNGPVLMDSGGFLFQKKKELTVQPREILDLYYYSKPDFGVVLDHPLNTSASYYLNMKRWKKTLANTAYMFENNGSVALMPVTHGYGKTRIRRACDEIKDTIGEPTMIGIGSLVPLIKSGWIGRKNNGSGRKFLVDAIKIVRNEFPDAFMHVFGVGGTTTMHLMYALGVDSVDSMGWRMKAAHGAIQLPGIPDRFLSPRTRKTGKGRISISGYDKKILSKCQCPVCREKTLKQQIKLLDNEFKLRALHNAWVFYSERKSAVKNIQKDTYREFALDRMEKSTFKRYLN